MKKRGYQSAFVYNEIKRRIITLELNPGELIDEKRLMSELKVGRTPMREALLQLKNNDWIFGQPNKSTYIKELTLTDVRDLFESLTAIEKLTAYLAAQRMTPGLLDDIKKAEEDTRRVVDLRDFREIERENRQFHRCIARGSKNQYLASIHEDLRAKAERLAYLSLPIELHNGVSVDDNLNELKEQHHQIVECLERRDVEELERLSVEHVRRFQNRIITYLNHCVV